MADTNYSLNQTISVLKSFADSHLQIQRFGFEAEEQLSNHSTTGQTFPYMFVSPVDNVIGSTFDSVTLRVNVIDILQSDRSNYQEIINDTKMIMNDLKKYLSEESDAIAEIQMINDPIATPVNNFSVDHCAGHVMDIELETDTFSVCGIPFDTAPTFTGTTCPQDLFLKAIFATNDVTMNTLIIDSDNAGTYTSIADDGDSGTITLNINSGGFSVFTSPTILTISDTLIIKRTITSGTTGFVKLTGTYV